MKGAPPITAMLFINPMWDNESERIGKQKCTPLGYTLHAISDFIGFIGLLFLLGTGAYLGYRGIVGTFHTNLLWFFTVPLALAVLGAVLYRLSWMLARKKGFLYDYDNREASWMENGKRQTYKWKAAR